MGLYPGSWGFHQWNMLHRMALTYPAESDKERQTQMTAYLEGMCANLPCPGCSFHCGKYLEEHKPAVATRQDLKKWVVDFHNAVNKRLGKREWSYEEAERKWTQRAYNIPEWREIDRANQIRLEDDNKIEELQKEIQTGSNERTYKILSIVLGSCLAFVLLVVLIKIILRR